MSVLRVDKTAGVAVVTLSRPTKLNALNVELMIGLADLWPRLADDNEVRVVVLTGEGARAFSTGADLSGLAPLATGAVLPETEQERRWVANHQSVVDAALLRGIPFTKPVVAAVNGVAIGAGFELVLASDIRIMAREAYFQLPEVRWGLIPSGGALARLPRQIGWANAMEIVLATKPLSAARALELGLVNRVVEADQVLSVAMDWAADIAKAAPLALQMAKEAMVRGSGTELHTAFAIEAACQAVVLASEDAREGPRAYIERRDPQFTGK